MDVMMCATYPNRAVVTKFGATKGDPLAVEFVYVFWSAAFIPITFVHAHLLATLHANASVAEEVRRVGKNGINGVVLYFC